MTPSGPRWALSVSGSPLPSFDSCAVGDHFRVAVAIKAHKTDLSYPAVGLSDYAGMMLVAACQPVVTIALLQYRRRYKQMTLFSGK